MISASANIGYTPPMYSYGMPQGNLGNSGGTSMIASDGTLSLPGVAQAVTRNLQNQAQQINQLQQQGASATNSQGNGQSAGGQGSATMLTMQAKVGEYTTALQQGTSIMSGLSDTHKSVAQNTK
ncbi:MAG: hypothetical protein WCA85_35375 [Paraburkholderia sp.]|uniref:hypothetical protein n=1 Tax=Paraburkholderia sp. TaxID=1926495 RepID=UPI003C5E1BD5